MILDTGTAANLACSQWLNRNNSMLGKMGPPRVPTYPAQERFKFGEGRMGDVRFAADKTRGIAGAKGNSTAFVLDADIPALFRKMVSESLGGRPDFLGAP